MHNIDEFVWEITLYIFRGESLVEDERVDPNRRSRVRLIKQCLESNDQLPSKMIGNGCPFRIFRYGLQKNVVEHISEIQQLPGNPYGSHFISFSEKESKALDFAKKGNTLSLDAINSHFDNYKSNETWAEYIEFILIKFNIENKQVVNKNLGLYKLNYSDNKNLLLLNSSEYLKGIKDEFGHLQGFEDAEIYALDEAEWLVLPIDELNKSYQNEGFTALMDVYTNEIRYEIWLAPDYVHAL